MKLKNLVFISLFFMGISNAIAQKKMIKFDNPKIH